MNKEEIRKKYKSLRKELTEKQIENYSIQIANRLLQLDVWGYSYYHIFLPIDAQKEVNTEFILHTLQGRDKYIVVSKSNFEDYSLTHFLLTDQTKLKLNKWGIPEPVDGIEISPEKIEVVFVPLLAYDSRGYRVGYGKGFYDRFLETSRPDLKIGLSFFDVLDSEIEDVNEFDITLDYCVSPNKLRDFKK